VSAETETLKPKMVFLKINHEATPLTRVYQITDNIFSGVLPILRDTAKRKYFTLMAMNQDQTNIVSLQVPRDGYSVVVQTFDNT
jgi:hypothetical protein